eukprot:1937361-Pyramimonas_sp.AAC.1
MVELCSSTPPLDPDVSLRLPCVKLRSGALFGLQNCKMASKTASKAVKMTPRRPKMAQDGSRGSQDGLLTA